MSLSFCYSVVKTSFNLPFSLLYNWRKQGILHSTKLCTHVPCSVDMIIGITLISFAQGYAKLTYLTFAAHWVQVWVVTMPQCLLENFLWHINLPRVWDLSPSTASQDGWGWQGPLGPSAALLQQWHPEQGAQVASEELQGDFTAPGATCTSTPLPLAATSVIVASNPFAVQLQVWLYLPYEVLLSSWRLVHSVSSEHYLSCE